MPRIHEIICIKCPQACRVELKTGRGRKVIKISGFKCREGKDYAQEEFKNPVRVLTTTVLTKDSRRSTLPVRSRKGIPKGMMLKAMESIDKKTISPPIKIGEVIVPNVAKTGVDIIASESLKE